MNCVFIAFWGIFRFHILGGLLFKATLDPNGHFWLLWPIFWCPIVFEGFLLIFFPKTQIWQLYHISLWNLLCWSISVDFHVTQMMWLIFVVCGQNFPFCGAHRQKASDPALQAENGPLSSRMGTFQRRRSIKVLSGYGCEL